MHRPSNAAAAGAAARRAAIVVERATYWDVGAVVWEAGFGALAVPLP